MSIVTRVNITKDDGSQSRRYALYATPHKAKKTIAFFDITKELEAANSQDKDDGYDLDTGPRFGFAVHNAIIAMDLHVRADSAWCRDCARDQSIEGLRPRVSFPGFWSTAPADRVVEAKSWSWEP